MTYGPECPPDASGGSEGPFQHGVRDVLDTAFA